MTIEEYNNWWFIYYSEMGVQGFPDPRDYDEDYYDYYRERQEELFNEQFNNYFENQFDF